MPVPVINLAQMREWEHATWATGQTEVGVIRHVGKKVAARALALTCSGDSSLLLAGKGRNGDDVRAAEQFLEDRKVILLDVTNPKAALAELFQRTSCKQSGTGFQSVNDRQDACPTLIIDGLFGIGLSRALDADWKKLIAAVNATQIPVLAVDVPSGLHADTGEHFGAAIEAAVTLTVGAPKTGMLAARAWPFVGRLEVAADAGLIPCPHQSDLSWTLPDDFKNFPPPRPVAGHKGDFGSLAIIAGSAGFHGAAVLAARAAQRAHPGRLMLFTDKPVYGAIAAQLQSVMVHAWKPKLKLPDSTSGILIGPGLAAPGTAQKLKAFTQKLWRASELPMVVDASALDWLPSGDFHKNAIRVVTPHPGEAARRLKTSAQKAQADRVKSLREISRRLGNCWVVLKGHQTLVGRS